ncbi:ATP-binding protein [Corynebacterium sp. TA-R-1]|uniref:ATP-binding protein n=1 Tax=Corynebacterium stercoris TaxID=2943490 RepID=A0ABT1FYT8_9CORY|nr:ATP-binding protein [Corynebacterium stercoris]
MRLITGVRRSGKSTLLQLYRKHLVDRGVDPAAILTINFEDLAFDPLRDAHVFHEHVRDAVTGGVTHLHVDEVQELDQWARVINSLRASQDLEICVTGSNASMFAGEGLTYLAGRYVSIEVFPLSLEEYRHFTATPETEHVETSYQQWMVTGGFARSVLAPSPELTRQLNRDLFDSIFTRDIALRGDVRDTAVFLKVASFVLDNAGSPLSANKIANTLKSTGTPVSTDTVDRYLKLMADAHLIYPCHRYDTRGRGWLKSTPKYYWVDAGLRDALTGRRNSNTGHDLENQVYLELLRQRYEVFTGVGSGGEIDFFARRDDTELFIQVALTALDERVLERELSSFRGLPPGARCVLLTGDRLPLATGHVEQINAFDFLARRAAL